MLLTSPTAPLSVIAGSVGCAMATELATESVISEMTVKASALITCPFCLVNTTVYEFMEIFFENRLHGFPANPIPRREGQSETDDQYERNHERPNVRQRRQQ